MPLQLAYALIVISIVALWALVEPTPWPGLEHTRQLRVVARQLTGALAIGTMSLAMVLAARPSWLESPLGGLDRMYRLHRWLGVSGLAFSMAHWAIDYIPRRGPRLPKPDPETMGMVQRLLHEGKDAAAEAGELALWALGALVVVALLRTVPYRLFRQSHRLLAPTYLVLVFHAVVLLRYEFWATPFGGLIGGLMAAGSWGAVVSMMGRIGARRKVRGEVAHVECHETLGQVVLDLRLRDRWPGHAAGQFAFLTLHAAEGAHPFTITSAWRHDHRLQFVIKGLGDYTRTLAARLRVGDLVTVEGPYGRFTFEGAAPRQIWVGAGIGITPFLARLQALATAPDGKAIDLFHPTAVHDEAAIGKLERAAEAAGVALHVLVDARDGLLTAERLTRAVPGWREADVWFCGPATFGHTLHRDLRALGLPKGRFHQELFELR